MGSSRIRTAIFVLSLFAVSALVGGLLGGRALADGRKPEARRRTFGQILSLVESEVPGDVDSTEMVEGAIQGMLRELDPHSNYLPPVAYGEMKDEQRGRFYGLGIQIAKRGLDRPLTIISPIDDTPAARAGLQAGDIISKIEGDETLDMTVQDAVRLLKGEKGTPVTITIHRPGDGSDFDVTIVRDVIPIESLRIAFMLDAEVGFISIGSFTSTTADELDAAVAQLRTEGMQKLVLDLRDNPGGLLDQAVQVSQRFIDEGKMVVYTRGRIPGADQDYFAEDGGEHIDVPVVVLVNNGSASASEIVSGAIQDHDRGLVVGETTFGKGLVQRVIPLRHGGALAVTTAKYYTPAGRLIQRDYTDLDDYFLHREPGSEGDGDGNAPIPEEPPLEDREVFLTASGRTVYGGGGITPDEIVRSERLPRLVTRMLRENIVFDFAVRYVADHPELQKGFEADDALVSEFRAYLDEREFAYEPADLEAVDDVVRLRLRAQISRVRWDKVEESRILASADTQLQTALGLFERARKLAAAGRNGEPGSAHVASTRVAGEATTTTAETASPAK
jgi:carboxyl-terminal processing protease